MIPKTRFASLALGLLTLVVPALAGPPLICHTYTIGNAVTLPWGTDINSWSGVDSKYNVKNLANDTLRLLGSNGSLLVRMETLRRAAVYAGKDTAAGLELAGRLTARALTSELKGENNSLALFDAGYFVESIRQLGTHTGVAASVAGIDGYDWAKRSLPGLGDKLTAEYALGLMNVTSPWPNEHIRRAVAGAQEGSLLAENLVKRMGSRSLAEVKREVVVKSASR